MGKSIPQLPLHHQQQQSLHGSSFFVQCSIGFSSVARLFSFKCVFVLLLTVSVLLTAIFSVFHFHHRRSGFDAKASIKHSATVQAYFRLQKPISLLLPQIPRLEYDINAEIGVPHTQDSTSFDLSKAIGDSCFVGGVITSSVPKRVQVVILSMHKASAPNWTHVVFGILSDPMKSPINAVSLSVLRSSLVELFTENSNLTLTTSIFGQPSSFDVLKFPGGITVIPKQSPSIWMLPQVFFNFTLPNSLREIEENFAELKQQLELGLHLMPYESIYMQVTNKGGSTRDPPVTIQASIMSNLGGLVPQRLKQLAQTITGSPSSRNLGLDHSVFGKVKEISLSSYLYHTLNPSTPSPAPSSENHHMAPSISPSPAISPLPESPYSPYSPPVSSSPAPSMDPSCGGSRSISPGPSPMYNLGPSSRSFPPRASTGPPSTGPPPMYRRSEMPPDLSPLPSVSYGSRPSQDKGYQKGSAPPPIAVSPSSSSSATGSLNQLTPPLFFFVFTLILLLN